MPHVRRPRAAATSATAVPAQLGPRPRGMRGPRRSWGLSPDGPHRRAAAVSKILSSSSSSVGLGMLAGVSRSVSSDIHRKRDGSHRWRPFHGGPRAQRRSSIEDSFRVGSVLRLRRALGTIQATPGVRPPRRRGRAAASRMRLRACRGASLAHQLAGVDSRDDSFVLRRFRAASSSRPSRDLDVTARPVGAAASRTRIRACRGASLAHWQGPILETTLSFRVGSVPRRRRGRVSNASTRLPRRHAHALAGTDSRFDSFELSAEVSGRRGHVRLSPLTRSLAHTISRATRATKFGKSSG